MRRRLGAFVASATIALGAFGTPNAANLAAQTAGPGTYSGSAATDLVHLTALNIPGAITVADGSVAPATAAVDSTGKLPGNKSSAARAANLDATLVGAVPLEGLLVEAAQTAPPNNAQPTTNELLDLPVNPVLDASVARSTAHARWLGADRCVPPGSPISTATQHVADAGVLQDVGGDFFVTANNDTGSTVSTNSQVGLVDVAGQSGKGLRSVATTQLTGITLFKGSPNELTVNVLAPPVVTAQATGRPGGATVTYSEPILQIVQDGEVVGELDAAAGNTTLDVAPLVRLELGTLENVTRAADGTRAAGTATLLEVTVLTTPLPIDPGLTVRIAGGTVAATVPVGGVNCPDADNPLREAHKDLAATTVAPGQTTEYAVTVPNRGTCPLTVVKVVDTVTGPAGTQIVSTTPQSTVNGLTATWDDIGPIQPNETKVLIIRVRVPGNAPGGFQLKNHADITATQRCADGGEQSFTKPVDVSGPTVGAPTDAGCSLDGSNVGSSHRDVFAGETFTHYVHVYNDGTDTCPDVTATYTIPNGASFVSCTGGCTVEGRTVVWRLGPVNGGESRDVSATLKVDDGVPNGTVLPGVATIRSGGESRTARIGLPRVTGRSVLEPPNPAGGAASGELPATGGPGNLLLAGGALVALALAGRRYLLGTA